jgi:hypothetical protein
VVQYLHAEYREVLRCSQVRGLAALGGQFTSEKFANEIKLWNRKDLEWKASEKYTGKLNVCMDCDYYTSLDGSPKEHRQGAALRLAEVGARFHGKCGEC